MMQIKFYNVSEQAQSSRQIKDLITVIKTAIDNIAIPIEFNIKIIGYEGELSSSNLLLFDLLLKEEYMYEINLFSIRISKIGYEVLTSEEEYATDEISSTYKVITNIFNNTLNCKNNISVNNKDIQSLKLTYKEDTKTRKYRQAGRYFGRRNSIKRIASKNEKNKCSDSISTGKAAGSWEIERKGGRKVVARKKATGFAAKSLSGKWHVKEHNFESKKQPNQKGKSRHRP